jgi:hypothetical protein
MTFRLSEVATALSTQEKSTLVPRRRVYRIPGIDCQVEDDRWFIWQNMAAAGKHGG